MNRFARLSAYVPTALVVIGFILIFMGWNGAASLDYTEGQIPYVISGGLTGLAFIFFGSAGIVAQAIKRNQAAQEERLDRIAQNLQRVSTTLSLGGNGEVANGDLVVIGSSSFHLPDCRMIGDRPGLAKVGRQEAVAEGLEPCRVCNP
jgi:hypothetical protein